MREPRLYLPAFFSFFIHGIFFALSLVLVSYHSKTKIDKPYIVSIVSDTSSSQVSESPSPSQESALTQKKESIPTPPKPVVKETPKKEVSKKTTDDKVVQDRISEMMAKKRIEKLVAMRANIDIASSNKQTNNSSQKGSSTTQGRGKGDYLSMVRAKIMEKWVYPESIDKELEAIITIKIKKDGSVQLIGLEKSSGNRLFDRTALSAINSITSLPAPPDGIEEIGIRFKP
ncbi:MAG: TonB family protein [Thermodesulfovibrionales bacterium]|nr:TonB family protein [Thermodesulfovibrionales bacterium]